MIRIQRLDKPKELTNELQEQLTKAYLENSKRDVWNQSYIRSALLEMSYNKCCYCEKKLGHGNTDMHVDHFKPKSLYPEEVVSWDNLLPSCPDCNRSKQMHDTVKEPIINPSVEDPRKYFYLKDFFYKPYDTNENSLANFTIDVLQLNDLTKKCIVRYQIASEVLTQLNSAIQFVKAHQSELTTNTRIRNKAINMCRSILEWCVPTAEFSAFVATAVLKDENYVKLKNILIEAGIWNEELKELDDNSKGCIYATHS